MRNTAFVLFVFLILTICLQAQPANSASDGPQASSKGSDLPTLTGCLATAKGGYTLTEDNGQTHELSGGGSKLRAHVGQEVEIAGKPGTKTVDNTPPGGASNVMEFAVFEVKSVKKIADQCR